MARNVNYVTDINPNKKEWRIKVRVIRLWTMPNYINPDETNSIEMVLMVERVRNKPTQIRRAKNL